jgi:biopolymer transport protein ExbD
LVFRNHFLSAGLPVANREVAMSRKRKSSGDEDVELNLAAMLDMAFQLLTFFILTFKPAPVEGQISLRLPPPQPLQNAPANEPPGNDFKNKNLFIGFTTLAINLTADDSGKLARIQVANLEVTIDDRLEAFITELDKDLNVESSPFDQVIISVPTKLHYSELMRVMGVCTRQMIGGNPHNRLAKLSLVDKKNPDSL